MFSVLLLSILWFSAPIFVFYMFYMIYVAAPCPARWRAARPVRGALGELLFAQETPSSRTRSARDRAVAHKSNP